ncbi:hypothetical protein PspLS_03882 [Pyricularia sp. CBS 133598]|nr:hypothetical protein PspLS_03882 [Pyricularia sp. CBS 133598]
MSQNLSSHERTFDASFIDVAPPEPEADVAQKNSPTIETLYEGNNRNHPPGTYREWVDTPLKQAKCKNNNAITVYMIKDMDQPNVPGNVPLEYYRIDVRDCKLVAFLEPILKKKDAHLNVYDTATFMKPFQVLYECHEEIIKLCNAAAEDDELKPLLQLLATILGDMFLNINFQIESLKQKGLVSFKTAWAFFQHGTTVLATMEKTKLLCKVDQTSYTFDQYGKRMLTIRCKVIRLNGDAFVWEDHEVSIDQFADNRPVVELKHYPLAFHEDPDMVRSCLVAQGRTILDFQDLECRGYDGIADVVRADKIYVRQHVDGRIMIDVDGFRRHAMSYDDAALFMRLKRIRDNRRREIGQEVEPKSDVFKQPLANVGKEADKNALLLNEENLAFLFPLLEGYSLKEKRREQLLTTTFEPIAKFLVDYIQPVRWNDDAYSNFVHDKYQKDQILSFVANHRTNNEGKAADFIRGKSEGLLILLSGLRARARPSQPRPSWIKPGGRLDAKEMGPKLKSALEVATELGAVVLLDEADVFMSKRDYNHIHRNELVSVFLRELKYFRGTMFLTTNLLDNVDNAFLSRMSMHIVFKPLTFGTREAIWDKLLARQLPQPMSLESEVGIPGGESQLSERDLQELARWNLNGREITNVARMVRAWCNCKGRDMTLERLKSGIKVTSPFALKSDVDEAYSLYY